MNRPGVREALVTFTDPPHISIQKLAEPTHTQRRAFELLGAVIPTKLT